ncbi:MAG: PQQ-binding-like beta-propeller repeat protein [Planctomycetota bacterium]
MKLASKTTCAGALSCLLALIVLPNALMSQGSGGQQRPGAARPETRQQPRQQGRSSQIQRPSGRYLREHLLNHHANVESELNSETIGELSEAWTIETSGNVTHTPLVDQRRVYFADWSGVVYAADLESGEVLWEKEIAKPNKDWDFHGFAGTGAQNSNTLFEATVEGMLYAIDKENGDVLWETRFTEDEHAGCSGRLTWFEGRVFVPVQSVEEMLAAKKKDFEPNFRGHVVAVDAENGDIIWNQPLVHPPHNGVAVWSGFAIDPEDRSLFFTTSNNYTGQASELSDALVMADLETGTIRSFKQVVQNDVWTMAEQLGPDYAFGAAPQLFKANLGGQSRKLIAAGNKNGTLYVWDKDTGREVWTSTLGYGNVGGGILAEASIGRDAIFFWSNNSFTHEKPKDHPMDIAAVDATTGHWRWVKQKAQPAALRTAGYLANDVYLVPSLDGRIRGYRADDGETVWTSGEHGSIGSSLCVDRGRLLFGTGIPESLGGIAKGKGLVVYGASRASAVAVREASAPNARRIRVVAKDHEFEPATINVRPGEAVRIELVNQGETKHSIDFELPSGEVALEEPLEPDETGALTFTAPDEADEYTFYCPVGDHREKGMKGKLVVKE